MPLTPPLEVDERYVDKYREQGISEAFARIYGMVEKIDENMGRLFMALDELGVSDSTIVIFTSDHGPCGSANDERGNSRYNSGLRGIKGTFYQGGIKVPCFVRWPGKCGGGKPVDCLANPIDWVPTLSEIVGFALPEKQPPDGTSLLPDLLGIGNKDAHDRLICMQWHRGNQPAMYRNFATIGRRYKLIRNTEDGDDELFDLVQDPQETRNLAQEYPEIVTDFLHEYERWFRNVSSTRSDNYAPPRIVAGSKEGDPVYLTWQDWRTYGLKEGWSVENPGYWEIELAETGQYEFVVDVLPMEFPTKFVLELHNWKYSLNVPEGCWKLGMRLPVSYRVQSPELPAGPARLHAFLESDSQRFGIVQVIVRK